MRYYLDTNILVFLMTGQREEICTDVKEIISDYTNQMMTSSVCVQELVHLNQMGKFAPYKRANVPSPTDVLGWLDDMGIDVGLADKRHIQRLSELPMRNEHHDPNDRLIIAQSIVDKIPLVSSDQKFEWYRKYGLDFIFNDR